MSKTSVMDKVAKEFPGFVSTVEGMSDDELRTRLGTMAAELAESQEAEEDDVELQEAKKTVSELSAPYKDVAKAVKLKTRYIVKVLEQRGKSASAPEEDK